MFPRATCGLERRENFTFAIQSKRFSGLRATIYYFSRVCQ